MSRVRLVALHHMSLRISNEIQFVSDCSYAEADGSIAIHPCSGGSALPYAGTHWIEAAGHWKYRGMIAFW
jgi:hypothetical protein